MEALDPVFDRPPGGKDDERGQKGGHHEQKKAHAVDAHLVDDPVLGKPGGGLDELHRLGRVGVVTEKELQGDHEAGQHGEEGHPPDGFFLRSSQKEQYEQGPGQREKDKNR